MQNASRQFGTANPQFAYIVTGTLLPGDRYDSAVTGVAAYATTDTPSSAVGTTYPITVSGLSSQNYEIATVRRYADDRGCSGPLQLWPQLQPGPRASRQLNTATR